MADLRADRTATAGDDDRLAVHQLPEALHSRSSTLDAAANPRHATGVRRGASPPSSDGRRLTISPQAARPHHTGFRMRLRLERRRRHHHARNRLVAPGEIADHVLDVVDVAQHWNIADRLAAIGHRRRQHADRPHRLYGAAFDAAQQNLGVGGAPDQQRRRGAVGPGMMADSACTGNNDRQKRSALRKDTSRNQYRMMVTLPTKNVPWTLGARRCSRAPIARASDTVATRKILSASGSEMKRHFVVVRLKR